MESKTEVGVVSRRSILAAGVPATLLALAGTSLARQDPAAPAAGMASGGKLAKLFAASHANGEYKLPPLPYAVDALEPHIDKATMELHHGKHHQSYVTNLNNALKKMSALKPDADNSTVEALQRDISFNAGGHYMHTLFWGVMGPNAGGSPVGELAKMIDATFGSFDNFKAYFTKVALTVKGSGWGVLSFDPIAQRLFTSAMGDQDTRLAAGTIPLIAIDVWEHAYYLKYQNRRADYIAAWFNTIDWAEAELLLKAHQHVAG